MPSSVSDPVRGYGGVYRRRVVAVLLTIMLMMVLGGRSHAGFINGGFEEGTFNGWTLEHGTSTGGLINFSPGADGHAYIINNQTDPYSPFDSPFFGSFMARMNEVAPDADATRISQTATMLPGETDLYVVWGAVLQDAGHDPPDQPFFRIEITKNGDIIASESFNVDYLIVHGRPSAAGFYYDSGHFHLSGFVPGDVVKVSLTAADCSATGHSGYAYLDGIGTVAIPQEIGVSESEVNLTSGTGEISYYDEFLGNDGIKRTFTIQNYGTDPLENLTAVITGPGAASYVATPLETNVLTAGQRTTFDVTFHPLALGPQTANLRITSNDADEGNFDIQLTGNGSDTMQASFPSPAAIPFVHTGFSATGIQLLQPTLGFTPGVAVKLTLLDNTGPDPVIGTFTGLPEGSMIQASQGPVLWNFQLSYIGGTGNDIELTHIDPEIDVLPEALTPPYASGQSTENFGGVLPGSNVVRNFVAGNSGNVPLTNLSATIEGPHAGDFAVAELGSSLATGASDPFTVTFTPLDTGTRSATLVIHSDDPDESEFRIFLTGEGHVVLPAAVDQPAWTPANGGNAPWFGQAVVTHDGIDAGRSGPLADGQSSTMDVVVEGPGTLSFWWKVSSEAGYDFLEFAIDGAVQKNRISGEIGWEQRSFIIPTGSHTLSWRYQKDLAFAAGTDAGWVDEIVWSPSSITLAEAIDNPAWTLANTGNTPWLSQTTVTHDGADAGRSGPVTDGQSTTMDTVVEGPGTLSFWWKASSESGYDFLEFTVDGSALKIRISGEVDWEKRTIPIGAGLHTLSWRYVKDGNTAAGADAGWVDQVVFNTTTATLAEAVDQPAWSFTDSGTVPWQGQTTVTHDTIDAGRSGTVTDGQSSTMDTVVDGPGTLSFWWKVSSEADFDYLEFTVDGTAQKVRISGQSGWQQRTHTLPAGSHTLSWRYVKDGSTAAGADAGWVDQIVWTPADVPLAEAVDQPTWTFTNPGDAPWLGQTTVTQDAVDAARSGPVADSQSSTMTTVVEGPGTISFWWKVSSEANADFLEFTLNATEQKARISGEAGWEKKTYTLSAGSHTLGWRYFKDATTAAGSDAGWVDRITFTEPGGTEDSAYSIWATAHFSPTDLLNPAISGPDADPNHDGVVNLLHFAFNLAPFDNGSVILQPGTGTFGLPTSRVVDLGGRRLVVEYIRRKASTDPGVTYTAQFTGTLGSWQNSTTLEIVESIDATWERVIVQDHIAGSARRFVRVQVLPPPAP